MGRPLRWTYKLLKAWRDGGFRGMVKAGVDRIIFKGEAQDHEYSAPIRTVTDVLFVNGCPPQLLPHPYRYRVTHQMEQLRATGYTAGEIFYEDCEAESVLSANVIIFYRCPYTESIGDAIRLAKAMNKRVLFDIDDLVVDTVYTDLIPEIQGYAEAEKAQYDDGVRRYGKTLKLCGAALTTTERLAAELKKYVPDVYINRNCASEEMLKISEDAWKKVRAETANAPGEVILGFFSGSTTHNADFDLIRDAVRRVMDENPGVRLLLMGKLDPPEGLEAYGERIMKKPFADWRELPEIIAGVDLNLAPITDSIFNEAKSENKWVEAALVRVPTVASRRGAFERMMEHGRTGWLAGDDGWYEALTEAVRDSGKRREIGENAYQYCKAHCVTTGRAGNIRDVIEKTQAPHVAFVLPSSNISGGIMVALRHACFLQDAGWNVDIMVPDYGKDIWTEFGHSFSCIAFTDGSHANLAYYDLMVATMWTTVAYVRQYPRVARRAYLVQNYETDFYVHGDPQRMDCEGTYYLPEREGWCYLTISRWCAEWLRKRYAQNAARMHNGIDLTKFCPAERDWTERKIRVLIEGDCAAEHKNVDESFRIAGKLDPEKYEIWCMTYNGQPKEGYRCDKLLQAVPYEDVGQVYAQCDIQIKSSWLESFSYPPLEMMATGGWNVLVQNGGNSEYLRDGENCLTYPLGDEDAAVRAIERIAGDPALRAKLREGGLRTAAEREWETLRREITDVYQQTAFGEMPETGGAKEQGERQWVSA